ncbi:MAG: serine hydrolase domain-containing protein [Umezawaea sp.]
MMRLLTSIVFATVLAPAPALDAATIDRLAADVDLPGLSVAVTKDDRVVLAKGYGHDSTGAPLTAATPMRLASVSKSFVAMAVMTLVDAGRIALDAPVADQLPEFHPADPRAKRITVRHLLNQTSGLSDATTDIPRTWEARSLRDLVGVLDTATLADDPGRGFHYHNPNYGVAARLVEVAGGQAFDDYLRDHVLTPLGMRSHDRVADGYVEAYGRWFARPELPSFEGDLIISSADDMARWLIAQQGRRPQVVSAEGLRTMHTPPSGEYAMGWGVEVPEQGHQRLSHSGNLFTYTAAQVIVPETGYGFAVMTNSTALLDEAYELVESLIAVSEGRSPGSGTSLWPIDLGLGLATLAVAALGVRGVRRAGRKRSPWRAVPHLLAVVPLLGYPAFVGFLSNGRTVTWPQLAYVSLPIVVLLGVLALAGTATATARLVALSR